MSDSRTYVVQGMTCAHCVSSIREEVLVIPGVEAARVDLETGALTITSRQALNDDVVREAVEEAGYDLA